MRVRYTLRARADLHEIRKYLQRRQLAVAQRLISAIERQVAWLSDFPYMAPATDEPGVRELTLARYSYKIYYEVADGSAYPPHSALSAKAAGAKTLAVQPRLSPEEPIYCPCAADKRL